MGWKRYNTVLCEISKRGSEFGIRMWEWMEEKKVGEVDMTK